MRASLTFTILCTILILNFACTAEESSGLLYHRTLTNTYYSCNVDESRKFPYWCTLMNLASLDAQSFLYLSDNFSNKVGLLLRPLSTRPLSSQLIDHRNMADVNRPINLCSNSSLPIVLVHGMGDSCFNEGLVSMARLITNWTGLHTVCIPMGSNQQEDTSAGYFLNMDASVDKFAESVQADSKMKLGFHAIGFSQGNNIIRGYMAKYNTPLVHTFISINGVNAGVGAVPYCVQRDELYRATEDLLIKENIICRALMEVASKKAYSTFAQLHSFQANYWRDPRPEYWDEYLTFSQLAKYNNEVHDKNETWKDNFGKSKKFVWVMAERDEIVWPKEGEQWGAPDPRNPFHNKILERNQTQWFKDDYFGLRTAEERGRNFYEKFDGGHLQFSVNELKHWIQKYICV